MQAVSPTLLLARRRLQHLQRPASSDLLPNPARLQGKCHGAMVLGGSRLMSDPTGLFSFWRPVHVNVTMPFLGFGNHLTLGSPFLLITSKQGVRNKPASSRS